MRSPISKFFKEWVPIGTSWIALWEWLKQYKVPTIVLAVLTFIWSYVVSSVEFIHSFGWGIWLILALFLTCITISAIAGSAWIWRYLFSSHNEHKTPQITSENEASESSIDDVSMFIEGKWINSPFQCGEHGLNESNEPVFSEDLYLTIVANRLLKNVTLTIEAYDPSARDKWSYIYHHKGVFEETVTPGIDETLRIFRRMFSLATIRYENANGGHTQTRIRRELGAKFFDGTDAEVDASFAPICSVEVRVDEKEGRIIRRFNLDLQDTEMPHSRLIVTHGPIQVKVGHHYVKPMQQTTLRSLRADEL